MCAARSSLASTWRRSATACDGNIAAWLDAGLFVWMPAHKSVAGLSAFTKSNGVPLDYVEWRANCLTDMLAKRTACAMLVDPDL